MSKRYEIDMKLPSLEEWRPVKKYEGLYEISNLGEIRSLDRIVLQKHYSGCNCKHIYKGKILKQREDENGYMRVGLTKNKKQRQISVHRLVAEAFLEKREYNNYINHLDTNPRNNQATNLEWCTQSHNIQYAYDNGTKTPPHMKKVKQLDKDGNFIKEYISISQASRETGAQPANIRKCCVGERNYAGGYKWQYTK